MPLNLWDNALAADRSRLSTMIKDRLHGALHLTQLQQEILDQTVQQAIAECSGDPHSGTAQHQTSSSGTDPDGARAELRDREAGCTAERIQHKGQEQMWPPSMIQQYLPRSMLVPGTTCPPFSTEPALPLDYPQLTQQPAANYLAQHELGGHGDLFLGLASNSFTSPFDNTEYHPWPAISLSTPRPT